MQGGYTRVDTLSLQWGGEQAEPPAAPLPALPVLAKVSEVCPAAPAADAARSGRTPSHRAAPTGPAPADDSALSASVVEAAPPPTDSAWTSHGGGPRAAKPATAAGPARGRPPQGHAEPGAAPADSASRQMDRPSAPAAGEGAAAASATRIGPPAGGAPADTRAGSSDWITALLRLDEVLARHSREIVLLTLLAAAGLTIALLRGDPGRIDSGTRPAAGTADEPALTSKSPARPPSPPAEERVAGVHPQRRVAARAIGPVRMARPGVAAGASVGGGAEEATGPPIARLSRVQPTERSAAR